MLDLFHARFRQVAVVVPILTGHSKSRRVPTVAEAWQGTLPHRTRESHNFLLGVCLPSEAPLRYTRTRSRIRCRYSHRNGDAAGRWRDSGRNPSQTPPRTSPVLSWQHRTRPKTNGSTSKSIKTVTGTRMERMIPEIIENEPIVQWLFFTLAVVTNVVVIWASIKVIAASKAVKNHFAGAESSLHTWSNSEPEVTHVPADRK